MDERYNFQAIEAKWQRRWEEEETFRAEEDSAKPKFYGLEFFPYPSGAGLHVVGVYRCRPQLTEEAVVDGQKPVAGHVAGERGGSIQYGHGVLASRRPGRTDVHRHRPADGTRPADPRAWHVLPPGLALLASEAFETAHDGPDRHAVHAAEPPEHAAMEQLRLDELLHLA